MSAGARSAGARISGAPLVQSAVNFSEGRDPAVIAAIVDAAATAGKAVVADWSADPDHHRMVVTLLGAPHEVRRAVLASARVAVARIDLRDHHGVHPRLGAVDVVPLTPIRDITLDDCIPVAAEIGHDLAERLALPVYFYEASSRPGHRVALPDIRRGGFEALVRSPLMGDRAPDVGPGEAHPTAGAVVVGARHALVACNVVLDSDNVAVARRIAGYIRRERDDNAALEGVRALGLPLPSRGLVQVSLNLTRPERTPLPGVYKIVSEYAAREGVASAELEVIGLVPEYALAGASPQKAGWRGYREQQVLEFWMARL